MRTISLLFSNQLDALDDWLTSCLKMKPETPATSSARNTKVKNMAYCRRHANETITQRLPHLQWILKRAWSTDQFEHPWAAAACGKAAKQPEDNDGGSGPDEDIWGIGALVRRHGQIGLQTHLPPYSDGQQDHSCELKTAGSVSLSQIWWLKSELEQIYIFMGVQI